MTCCCCCCCSFSFYCLFAHSMAFHIHIREDVDKREIEITGNTNDAMGYAETLLQNYPFHKIMKGAANEPNLGNYQNIVLKILFNFPSS